MKTLLIACIGIMIGAPALAATSKTVWNKPAAGQSATVTSPERSSGCSGTDACRDERGPENRETIKQPQRK